MTRLATGIAAGVLAIGIGGGMAAAPAQAKDEVQLNKCTASLGTIAVIDGDTQGWSEYGLGSPRELINALALESGCFTPVNTAAGEKADFLMNVVAGSSEEVDESIEMAKSAAAEGLIRSGAAGSILSKVPMGGAILGMFGGLGGRKQRVAAGIKLLSPANGLAVATGSGEVRKSSLNFSGNSSWSAGANAAGYAGSKDGKMLTEAFVIAFNAISAQQAAIATAPKNAAQAPAADAASTAVDTVMRAGPAADAAAIRTLRAGTALTPTGAREGLFIEVEDNYGTRGWVSVEDLT